MKHTVQFSILLLLSLFLGGCSLNKDVEKLYKTEAPLEVNIILPEQVSPNKPEMIKAVLTQDGKTIKHADFVHFEIWKKDGSVQYGMEPAKDDGNGTYSLSKVFNQEGLYVIKVHAGNQGSMVMPRKQFVVGQVSEEELNSLKESSPNQEGDHAHHH
ncbi:FixH family protein [Bacillus sp. OTU530]|uniref:FixH family protein n=1 Tax=Bacillus sp. OTU530 TaxID=3043862 RepID=UPI00313CE628